MDRGAFLAGLSKLVTMPSRNTEAADVAALDAAWWSELIDLPWVTNDVWARAVSQAFRTCDFRPAFAELLDICRYVVAEDEREEQKALPPPEPDARWARKTGAERVAFLERHMAIGVLRGRGVPTPSEQDIAGVIGQLRAKRFCAGTLERIAAGEVVSAAELIAAGAWRKGGRSVTDAEARAAYERRGKRWPGAGE